MCANLAIDAKNLVGTRHTFWNSEIKINLALGRFVPYSKLRLYLTPTYLG